MQHVEPHRAESPAHRQTLAQSLDTVFLPQMEGSPEGIIIENKLFMRRHG